MGPVAVRLVWLAWALAALGCASPTMQPTAEPDRASPSAAPSSAKGARPASLHAPGSEPTAPAVRHRLRLGEDPAVVAAQVSDEALQAALHRASGVRGLRPLRPVTAERLGRSAVIARIKAKVERDLPPQVLRAQGELLGALALIPPDYDYLAGIYALLEEQVAGFYDPEAGTLVLLDDLSDAGAEETLVHEQVHALQDQHYGLQRLLKYRPGDSDWVAAAQTLSEGDATSAMFDAVAGSAFAVPEDWFRMALVASTALSKSGGKIPRILQKALIAPYVDGFSLVQALRMRGGWPAVDAMWRDLPASTEQVIHLDKYDQREPPLHVSVPSLKALGEGWSVMDHDVLGEQGLRLTLTQWATKTTAANAAAGWGGDRYVVARRQQAGESATETEYAAAWVIRLDTRRDAAELALVLASALGRRCRERPLLGALTWMRRGATVVIAAGPYRRGDAGKRLPSPQSCTLTRAWAQRMVRAVR